MTATYSMMMDWRTGEVTFRGKDGRTYSEAELAAAEAGARRGDADAKATLAAIQRPAPASREDARQMMEADMDECPLCQELKAKGEWNPVHGGDLQDLPAEGLSAIDAWLATLPRDAVPREAAPRPPNWWQGRRAKRRR